MPYQQTRWKLDALLPGDGQALVDQALAVFEKKVKGMERWRAKLKATLPVKDFLALLKDYEAMLQAGLRVYAYAQLKFSENTQDQAALALAGRTWPGSWNPPPPSNQPHDRSNPASHLRDRRNRVSRKPADSVVARAWPYGPCAGAP